MQVLSFLNNPKDLDASYRMDLDFWDCLEGKSLSYNQRNLLSAFSVMNPVGWSYNSMKGKALLVEFQ